MSRQWILFPLAIGKLKLTKATVLGFDIPKGGSNEAMKSDNCENLINWVACGSYLKVKKWDSDQILLIDFVYLLAPSDVKHF